MDSEISLKTSVDVARIRCALPMAERCLRHLAPSCAPESPRWTRKARGSISRGKRRPARAARIRGFPGCICASVNNVAAHGIPSNREIEPGDVLSIDITVSVNGWHGDAAWTYLVGEGDPRCASAHPGRPGRRASPE